MKAYGANKATEFTKKQINVVYAINKKGDLTVKSETMKEFYNLADYYGFDDNKTVELCETKILKILEAVFSKNLVEAQNLIDEYEKM